MQQAECEMLNVYLVDSPLRLFFAHLDTTHMDESTGPINVTGLR